MWSCQSEICHVHTLKMEAASSSNMSALHVHTDISHKTAVFIHQHHCENSTSHYCTFFPLFSCLHCSVLWEETPSVFYSEIAGACFMCLNSLLPPWGTCDISFLHTNSSEDISHFEWQFVYNILLLSNSFILQVTKININLTVTKYQLCCIIIVYSLKKNTCSMAMSIVQITTKVKQANNTSVKYQQIKST
jgi:hypothetical protein